MLEKRGQINSTNNFGPVWPSALALLSGSVKYQKVNVEEAAVVRSCVWLCVVSGLVCLPGCSDSTQARVDVAARKLVDKLDDALGKLDVQKAEIDNGIKSAKLAVDGVRKAKIKAQVSLGQLDEKVRPHQDNVAKCDETLAKLRDAIKADKPADFGGKTYSIDDLKGIAGKVIQARKASEDKVKGFDTARQSLQNVVTTFSNRQQELETRISNLQSTNSKLDAEMAAVKAMKQASSTMGDGSMSLMENLDELEAKLASLSADVQGELAGESEKWSSAGADSDLSDVDAFINAAQTPSDPVAEIDQILGF